MENRHYFTEDNDKLASDLHLFKTKINNIEYQFYTDNGIFAKNGLDYATKIFLENLQIDQIDGKILDIGCGYGVIGIAVAKEYKRDVFMIDINRRAIALSKKNIILNNIEATVIESDCLSAVLEQKFSQILTNPPIHAGKKVVYRIFEEAYQGLLENGSFWFIIQKKHGAPSAIKKCQEIFSIVEVIYQKKGFYIIKCAKSS